MSVAELQSPLDFRQIAAEKMGDGGLFVYDSNVLGASANRVLDLKMPFGMTARYAAKANPHPQIVAQFDEMGLHFDASSAYEAQRLLRYGVEGAKISLSSQVLLDNEVLRDVLQAGVLPVATSIAQIGRLASRGVEEMAIRINPGKGSGHNNRTNVGGPASSFGIWHKQLPQAMAAAKSAGVTIDRLHTHIGSGADPDVWQGAIQKSLAIVEEMPDVTTLDIGGGYKVARMPGEPTTDMHQVGEVFAHEIAEFAERTGREIKLEIEPGTYLVALAGTLLGRVEEQASTDTYDFLKLNVGMNAILRPSLYGAQHPIAVHNDSPTQKEYVVVGPCCESGDILTPAPNDPEGILPRLLNEASEGDIVSIGGAGAYCASMSAERYNDIPPATELVV